jgi:hypothetical protein
MHTMNSQLQPRIKWYYPNFQLFFLACACIANDSLYFLGEFKTLSGAILGEMRQTTPRALSYGEILKRYLRPIPWDGGSITEERLKEGSPLESSS